MLAFFALYPIKVDYILIYIYDTLKDALYDISRLIQFIIYLHINKYIKN